jgi:subtilisin family serine protease
MNAPRTTLLLGLSLALAACGQQAATPSPQSEASVGTLSAQANQKTRYLVGFKRGAGVDRAAVARAGGEVTQEWQELDAAAVRIPASAVAGLSRNPNVEYVEEDVVRYALGSRRVTADARPTAPAPTAQANTQVLWTASGEVTWGDNALKVPTLRSSGYMGAGVAVCVGDTGIDANHREFGGMVKGYRNFMGDGRDNMYALNDVNHHGRTWRARSSRRPGRAPPGCSRVRTPPECWAPRRV